MNWKEYTSDSIKRWDENADFWDNYMGDEDNQFHRELIRPNTINLLKIKKGQTILDIACGHGNFSRYLAEQDINVIAFDCSKKMIDNAKTRSSKYKDKISYHIIDATNYEKLIKLGINKFDSAVSNMGFMDIADINPLLKATHKLLKDDGKLVFSVMHPCFQTPNHRKIFEEQETDNEIKDISGVFISKYIQPKSYLGVGIRNQPIASRYFHRPLSVLFNECFNNGFVIDDISEPVFEKEKTGKFDWYEIPAVLIVRLIKSGNCVQQPI